jgi:pimeloyl-ACP methyl ester carboxylesterase
MTPSQQLSATDGVRLAVYQRGDPAAPTIVAIHGYPDNAGVWDGVFEQLADRYHLVSYDVRGAGQSGQPAARSGYRLEQLEADFSTVIDALSPDRAVHVLAHDWGSIQAWQCVTSPRLQSRIASFTSISGPGLNQANRWLRSKLKPSRHELSTLLRQLGHSYYLALFQLPVLPELILRSGVADRLLESSERRADRQAPMPVGYQRSNADKVNGLELYRANLRGRPGGSRRVITDIPVQVLAPSADLFVGQPMQTEAPRPYARNLRTQSVPGSHWVVQRRPEVIARACADLVDGVEAGWPAV